MVPLDCITNALSAINVSGGYAEDTAKGLVWLNLMLSDWRTRKRFVFYTINTAFVIPSSKQTYLIGPGPAVGGVPDFVVASGNRPVKIQRANIVVTTSTPNIEYELDIIDTDDYAKLVVPAFSGIRPVRLYYQGTPTNGSIWLHPVPTDLTQLLQLFYWEQLVSVAIGGIAVDVPMAEGMDIALTLSLAEYLCLPFQKTISSDLERLARAARANVQSINDNGAPNIATDYPGKPHGGWSRADFLTRNF